MTTFGTTSDSLGHVMDLNDAMKAEFDHLMVVHYGSPNAFFTKTGVDKRNFRKILSKSPQIFWLKKHLDYFDVSIGQFFDAVELRQQGQ